MYSPKAMFDSTFNCLLIETSTDKGLIACRCGQKLLFSRSLPFGATQSQYLMPLLAEELNQAGIDAASLNCIGVGVGPGSYTGIRMGVAAAQALAYAWQLPLFGVASLDGFIPSEKNVHYAAIIDARIGGAYLQKGFCDEKGCAHELSKPEVLPLDALSAYLNGVQILVTPSERLIRLKLEALYPGNGWTWEEKGPCEAALFLTVQEKRIRNEKKPLELLYLRATEAELSKRGRT
ncbi:MAG: tRNA (adenosine(37)-N6)-threonylcarbamoyltransferase complex dimerization subunit type 1 TsaB [Parachlamydia sp.]|nr:tRNA (adenosine(37)-N6)-threonylcarbamoyltransferase complex dimerization subunit type 1 TsaB [Parachlamydia sp.]